MESESLKEIDVAIEENPTGTDYCSCRLPEDLRELTAMQQELLAACPSEKHV